ncbi:replication initiator protein A [Priestia megaterium]
MNYINNEKLNENKNAVEMPGQFFRVPKELFRNKEYRDLTPAAKIIYIELLDRVGLSIKNKWHDQYGRYYVKLSRESIPKVLGLSSKTFDRCKLQLVEHKLIKIYKVNKRVHHIYVLLPHMKTVRVDSNDVSLDILDFDNHDAAQKNDSVQGYNFPFNNEMPDF